MEEILASIRRIISEDDGPSENEAAPAAHAEPEHEPAAAFEPAPEPAHEPEPPADDVLELTDRVPPAETETVGDIEAYTKAEPEPEPEPPPPPPKPAPVARADDGLVSEPSASAAAFAFSQLTDAISMPTAGRTLEDLVRELLRPMLKEWLDANLPRIVEAKVAEEVERIARTRVR